MLDILTLSARIYDDLRSGWWGIAGTRDDTLDDLTECGKDAANEVANRLKQIRHEIGNRVGQVDRWPVPLSRRPISWLCRRCSRPPDEDDESDRDRE